MFINVMAIVAVVFGLGILVIELLEGNWMFHT
jgi:hypothetical protein